MTQLSFETWLNNFGLQKNPFAVTVADEERPQLSGKMFVHVNQFDRIRDESPLLVFAPHGGGKSSLRIRLATLGLPHNLQSDALIVEYTDFHWLLNLYKQKKGQLTHIDQIDYLIMCACESLFDLFFSKKTLTSPDALAKLNGRLKTAPLFAKAELATYFDHYTPHLLSTANIIRILSLLTQRPVDHFTLEHAIKDRRVKNYLPQLDLADNLHAQFLTDLIDNRYQQLSKSPQIIKQMSAFVETLSYFRITKIYFLVDRLDEILELVDDFKLQHNLLAPLLSSLELLEMPQLQFKFFLSQPLYEELRESPKIRNDRLLYRHAVHLEWTTERLIQLLNIRLGYFSQQEEITSLEQICEEQESAVLQKNILAYAQGSPRRLLRTVEAVLRANYRNAPNLERLISLEDWHDAQERLIREMPPVLHISRLRGGVETSEGFQHFTRLETEIIDALLAHNGQCEREDLVENVPTWSGVCTPETMEKAIGRLRRKLGDVMTPPLYLTTIRNRGYALQNYEIVE